MSTYKIGDRVRITDTSPDGYYQKGVIGEVVGRGPRACNSLVSWVPGVTTWEEGACVYVEHEDMELVTEDDSVNHPAHYNSGKIEVIDFIEDQQFTYFLGNVVKYVSRAGKKDPAKTVEDLRKARFYLDREITRLSAGSV